MATQQLELLDSEGHGTSKVVTSGTAFVEMVDLISEAYNLGLFGGTTHEVFPEVDRQSLAWRLYFTLPCAINYQRKSENLWLSALKTFDDPETRFVFDCRSTSRGLADYRSALVKHKLALQPEKQSQIWFTISKTLLNAADGDPAILFTRFENDIRRIKDFIAHRKSDFPYVSGPKLLDYWLYIFSTFTGTAFANKHLISVIPDVHVKRASVALGLVDPTRQDDTIFVAEAWNIALCGTRYAPCDVHAPLWRWSRAGLPSAKQLKEKIKQTRAKN